MVYDPIRDIELPSPAASSHHGDSHPSNLTPGSGYFDPSARPTSSSSSGYGIPYGAQPPAFQSGGNGAVYSPTAGSGPQMRRSVSGGLRGLLNDDQEDLNRRRSSGHTASSADQEEDHRPSIHNINDGGGGSNGNMTKSNSRSSIVSSSPANASPCASGRYLDQSGFLTPASTSRRTSRSPYPINTSISPGQSHSALPFHDPHTGEYEQPHPSSSAGPSRRRTSNSASTIRPMLPPDPIPRQEYYDSSRTTPGSQILPLPLRSPSVSVSPRSHHQALPGYPTSRPGSATSSTHPFSFQAPAPPAESPSYVHRHLSEDRSRDPSESRSRQTSLIPRIPSGTSNISRVTPARSPSPPPAPARQPYNPRRTTQPGSVLRPIQPEEIAQLRSLALVNNPLRRRRKKALPSWSGPSPGPSSRSTRDTPGEGDTSYFPNTSNSRHTPETSRRVSDKRRRDSISSGRPSLTPGTSMTPGLEVQDDKARGSGKRKQAARDDGRGAVERDSNGHDGQRRKVNDGHYVGNNAVASHYNARPEVGVQSREFSPIIGLKKFNNWIKSVLIGKFTPRADRGAPGARVLDIGCGKGGDLNKWRQAKVRLYVGLDIADMSVDQARERYNSMRFPGFEAYFFAHDCYAQPLSNILPDALTARDMYDNVTMQFCMHYAFESASKARMMIENVSRYLKRGGIFIGTIPDAELLLAKLDEVSEDSPELRFGNSCYFVTFTERKHQGMYGHAYRFYLQDAVDDVPEYVVHWENFVNLAMEYGLRLVYKKPFHQVLAEEQDSADFGLLLQRMGVVNPQGESAMDADQWEAANLYMAFAFEKY